MKYCWYLDNQEYQTEICEGVERNPKYGYKFHMNIDCVTDDLLKYFDNDALCFKVYGTPTHEKFRRQLTQKEEKKQPAKAAKESKESKPTKDAKDSKEKDTKSGFAAKEKTTTTVTEVKTEKKGKVVKMTTPDGQIVEVVKEKGGCCVIF